MPLSCFCTPTAIPDPQGKQVVFACRSGRRSITASVPPRRTPVIRILPILRRYHRMESGGPAQTNTLYPYRCLPFSAYSQRRHWLLWQAPLHSIRPRRRRTHRGLFLQLVGLYRTEGYGRLHQRDRHKGQYDTFDSNETLENELPAGKRATTSWSRPAIFWNGRSRPAYSKSSTRASLRISANSGESRKPTCGLRSGNEHAVNYMWGTTASASTCKVGA